jgi:hypothetical protein
MSERTLKLKFGELDLTLKSQLTYYDMKRLRGFGELAAKDHFAAIDMLVEIFWGCAHAGDPAVTIEMIEKNLLMPDGPIAMMAALFELSGPALNNLPVN